MSNANFEDVKKHLKKAGSFIGNTIEEARLDTINEMQNEIFLEEFEKGVTKAISALYEANVEDNIIIRLMNKYWGFNFEEALRRLMAEKHLAPERELKQLLKLQGYSDEGISDFMKKNKVRLKISENPGLMKLRHNPKKLKDEVLK